MKTELHTQDSQIHLLLTDETGEGLIPAEEVAEVGLKLDSLREDLQLKHSWKVREPGGGEIRFTLEVDPKERVILQKALNEDFPGKENAE